MSLNALWERFYPVLCGIAAVCAVVVFDKQLAEPSFGDALKKLYNVLLNVSAIYTGFLCNVMFTLHFGSTVTLDKARNTRSFRIYSRYVNEAFTLGFIAALVSVPMVAVEPVPVVPWYDWQTLLVALWAAVMAWSLAAAFRIGQTYLSLGHRPE